MRPTLHQAGGDTGLATPIAVLYLVAAEIINQAHDRVILPIGPSDRRQSLRRRAIHA